MENIFRWIKRHACAWMCAMFLIIPALSALAELTNRELVLYLPVLTYAVLALLSVAPGAAAVFSDQEEMCRSEKVLALIVPAVWMVCALSHAVNGWGVVNAQIVSGAAALAVFLRCGFGVPGWGILEMLLGVVLMCFLFMEQLIGCAVVAVIGIVIAIFAKGGRIKAALGGLYGVAVSIFLVIFVLLSSEEGMHDQRKFESEILVSPEGEYTAQLIHVIGKWDDVYSEYIVVKEVGSDINVLIGRLERAKRVYASGLLDWDTMKCVPFEWADENTLTVDGRSVEVR